jgi:hypothetical protein
METKIATIDSNVIIIAKALKVKLEIEEIN